MKVPSFSRLEIDGLARHVGGQRAEGVLDRHHAEDGVVDPGEGFQFFPWQRDGWRGRFVFGRFDAGLGFQGELEGFDGDLSHDAAGAGGIGQHDDAEFVFGEGHQITVKQEGGSAVGCDLPA